MCVCVVCVCILVFCALPGLSSSSDDVAVKDWSVWALPSLEWPGLRCKGRVREGQQRARALGAAGAGQGPQAAQALPHPFPKLIPPSLPTTARSSGSTEPLCFNSC